MICIFIALFQSNDSSKCCTIHATFTHSHPTAHQEQFGAQYLAQGHFDMHLGRAGIQTGDLPITRQPALPTEQQPPLFKCNTCSKYVGITLINSCMWLQISESPNSFLERPEANTANNYVSSNFKGELRPFLTHNPVDRGYRVLSVGN